MGQQPRNLEVKECRGDHQEFCGLIEFFGCIQTLEILDELVGDGAQRYLGNVQFVLGNEREQQVKRTLEPVNGNAKAWHLTGLRNELLRIKRQRHVRSVLGQADDRRAPPRVRAQTG